VIRMKKIKVTSDNKISMAYESLNKNQSWDEYSFTCADKARPEFYEAVKQLAEHVIEMCELPDSYLPRIDVRGVSVSYGGDDEIMGATISAQMTLKYSNCNLNINTPHKACAPYSEGEGDEKQLLSTDCVDDLRRLYDECDSYIKGDRAQMSLFSVA